MALIEIPIKKANVIVPALQRAIASAVNKSMRKASTNASRTVREVYNIKARDIKKHVKFSRATKGRAVAAFFVDSRRRFKLLFFGARDLSPGGVSYQIKKGQGRKTLQHAFVARMPSGHLNIFKRTGKTSKASKGIYKGREREEIQGLYGPTVEAMFDSPKVIDGVGKTLTDSFFNLIEHETDFYLSRVN